MDNKLNLNQLSVGEKAKVDSLAATGSMRRRLLDIGLIENTEIECIGRSPSGDPSAYLIRGAVIAIRSEDCDDILIKAAGRR
jgi:ferrous iron transport protein A